MAPPRNRRPGYSRRIQFSLFISYVIAVIGAVCGLGLILLSRLDPTAFHQLRGSAIDAGAPIANVVHSFVSGSQQAEESARAYLFAASQNAAMKHELNFARRKLIDARLLGQENARLRRLLAVRDKHPEVFATARLSGSGLASRRRYATFFAGAGQGVAPGQPIFSADGLIGRVLETGRFASRIMLITDVESSVPVKVLRDGTPALARGHGDGQLTVHALLPGDRPFRRNDILVTSGTGGVYPPDIPVALVTDPSGDIIIARPLAEPDRIDFALVARPYLPEPEPEPAPLAPGPSR